GLREGGGAMIRRGARETSCAIEYPLRPRRLGHLPRQERGRSYSRKVNGILRRLTGQVSAAVEERDQEVEVVLRGHLTVGVHVGGEAVGEERGEEVEEVLGGDDAVAVHVGDADVQVGGVGGCRAAAV